jgi:hypothetical protein
MLLKLSDFSDDIARPSLLYADDAHVDIGAAKSAREAMSQIVTRITTHFLLDFLMHLFHGKRAVWFQLELRSTVCVGNKRGVVGLLRLFVIFFVLFIGGIDDHGFMFLKIFLDQTSAAFATAGGDRRRYRFRLRFT